jgi:hypothetical protein
MYFHKGFYQTAVVPSVYKLFTGGTVYNKPFAPNSRRNRSERQISPYFSLIYRLCHRIHMKVHVGKTGSAGFYHLGNAKLCAQVHIFFRQLCLRRNYVVKKPFIEREVISKISKQPHR